MRFIVLVNLLFIGTTLTCSSTRIVDKGDKYARLSCTEQPSCPVFSSECEHPERRFNCPVTCKTCQIKLNCQDEKSAIICQTLFETGNCHTQPRAMAAYCQRTCQFCQGVKKACPEGWLLQDAFCYLVSTTAVTFDHALESCRKVIGANLMTIANEEEYRRVIELAKQYKVSELWTGISFASDKYLIYADNSRYYPGSSYEKFVPNAKKEAGYATVASTAKMSWKTEEMKKKYPYICSRLPVGFCANKCGDNAYCSFGLLNKTKKYGYYCQCSPGFYGDPYSACKKPCHCLASGDPNYNTFDNLDLHFMGRCTYTLSRTVKSLLLDKSCHIDVQVKNEDRRPQNEVFENVDVSWTKFVIIRFRGDVIRLLKGKKLEVNGEIVKSYLKYRIQEEDGYLTFNGPPECGLMKVRWDGDTNVDVKLDRTRYGEKTEGLCGNCNGILIDDWTTSRHKDVSKEKFKEALFGNSWRVNGSKYDKEDVKCDSKINNPPICSYMLYRRIKHICNSFTDKKHKTFGPCAHLKIMLHIKEACLWDGCASNEYLKERQCSYYAVVARTCRENSIRLKNWRKEMNCPMNCPANSHYTYDMPSEEPSCSPKPKDADSTAVTAQVSKEGCVCNAGYKRVGTECVKHCGCVSSEGVERDVGDEWVSPTCNVRFKCAAPRKITTKPMKCGRNAECDARDGRRDCFCKNGFQGNPYTACKDINECQTKPCPQGVICSPRQLCPKGKVCPKLKQCPKGFYCPVSIACTKGAKCSSTVHCPVGSFCPQMNIPLPCGFNSECTNTIGSYQCKCVPGYVRHPTSPIFTCINKNECKDPSICPIYSVCEDTIGSYNCPCIKGYQKTSDGKKCQKIDYCKKTPRGTKICKASHSYCKNSGKGFLCVCYDGYKDIKKGKDPHNPTCKSSCTGNKACQPGRNECVCVCKKGFEEVNGKCIRVNPCSTVDDVDVCGEFGICQDDGQGGIICKCKDGFKKINASEKSCTDINECQNKTICVKHAVCTNTPGSYRCDCKDCYKGIGSIECKPINRCDQEEGLCGDHAICEFNNLPCGHTCRCKDGYKKDNKGACVPRNQCEEKTDKCNRTMSDCVFLNPNYQCKCKDGTRLNDHTQECEDENECADECSNPCGDNEECVNLTPGFKCVCKKGFVKSGGQCQGGNLCLMKMPCSPLETCTDFPGSYKCTCKPGFIETSDGKCKDRNECEKKEYNKCSKNAKCINLPGTYACVCKSGYEGDGYTCSKSCIVGRAGCRCSPGYRWIKGECHEINECLEKTHKCHENATCENTVGGYMCRCRSGYCGTGYNCIDEDECGQNKHNCHVKAECYNLPGTFGCRCKAGFIGDGVECRDIDECKMNIHGCVNAICENSEGSFRCKCLNGFRASRTQPKVCKDINECEKRSGLCDENAVCENTPGSYKCVCKSGYEMKNKRCVDKNECETQRPCAKYMTCTNFMGSYKCDCQVGYRRQGKICINIDECNDFSPCHENAECKDNKGSFTCKCRHGFRGDGMRKCVDINECKETPGVCDQHSVCKNKEGGFECRCRAPHWQGSGVTPNWCIHVKINECKIKDRCGPEEVCKDLDFGFKCDCKKGYLRIEGDSCVDRDECKDGSASCPENSECENTIGSYTCKCEDGFEKDAKGKCVDINECNTMKHRCDPSVSECWNTDGSYECKCRPGYEHGSSRFECVDVNECEAQEEKKLCPLPNMECHNTLGSFGCVCMLGYGPALKGCARLQYVSYARTAPPEKAHITYKSPSG